MNKLGFAICSTNNGLRKPFVCNEGQWTDKVNDTREYIKLFDGLQDTGIEEKGNFVTFMSFDEGGCFLTQQKSISGRGTDFVSGWLYIPNTIDATGEEINEAYQFVRNILPLADITDSKDKINEFFSKEYPAKDVHAPYVASNGEKYGYRILGHYTLKEIVGKDRYQPYYSGYKAVFLLEKDGGVTIKKDCESLFKDLTQTDIVQTCILVPPAQESLQALGSGTTIHETNGSAFDKPILATKGSKITLLLSRKDFEDIQLPVTVSSDRQVVDLSRVKQPWMKTISASMFTVLNSDKKKIKNVSIFVNGKDISHKDIQLSEEACRKAQVEVSAGGYEDQTVDLDLSSSVPADNITLHRKVQEVKMKVELSNGKLGDMTIRSKDLPSGPDSPLKGYTRDTDEKSGKEILYLDPWFVLKQRLWGFLAAIAVGVSIIAFAAFDDWADTHHFKLGIPPWEKDAPAVQNTADSTAIDDDGTASQADSSLEAAIKYLDGQKDWKKPEMEKYPDLNGLFDDMNNFDLDKIRYDWHDKLAGSTNFNKIYESAIKTQDNAWDPKQGSHTPAYNKPGDEIINITNYCNWLDRDQTPKTSQGNEGSHPKAISKGGGKSGKPEPDKGSKGKSEKTENGGL